MRLCGDTLPVLVLALLVGGYAALRAARLPLTHDEARAYLDYVPLPLPLIFARATTATNHPLATAGAKAGAALFGPHPLALRLPALLALAVYLLAARRLGRSLRPGLRFPAFLLLVANPYLLEFFGLARGYGLALAALLAGMERLQAALTRPTPWRAVAVLAVFAAAVWANYTYLYLYGAALGAVLLASPPPDGRRVRRAACLFSLFLGLLLAYPLHQLFRGGQLYYGGTRGFWADTVTSLLLCTAHDPAFLLTPGLVVVRAAVAAAVLGLALERVWALRRRGLAALREPRSVPLLLLLGTAFLSVLAHHLFGVRYLVNRTALLFWPLFVLALVGGLARLPGRWGTVPAWGLALALALHTGRTADLRATLDWRYEAGTGRVLQVLRAAHRSGRKVVRLGLNWRFAPALEFYRRTWGWSWLQLTENPDTHFQKLPRTGFPPPQDFYYVFPEDRPSVRQPTRVLLTFPAAALPGLGIPRLLAAARRR